MGELARLLLLGWGYLGLELPRPARGGGLVVLATTRSAERHPELNRAGALPLAFDPTALAAQVDERTALIVTLPPDGQTDARCAELARLAGAAVYVSSTGVFGAARGRIDDSTPAQPDGRRAAQRLAAEQVWRAAGACVLRAAAIYGPGRGMHERIQRGSARIAGDGRHHICRIHVEDLAHAALRAVALRLRDTYVIADDEPAPQGEVVRYLAERLGLPCPPAVPLEAAPETLRHDRQIEATRFKRDANLSWRYPNYRVGFAACLAAERAATDA
jgi:hypothetical protein